jgi:hypothetical protein
MELEYVIKDGLNKFSKLFRIFHRLLWRYIVIILQSVLHLIVNFKKILPALILGYIFFWLWSWLCVAYDLCVDLMYDFEVAAVDVQHSLVDAANLPIKAYDDFIGELCRRLHVDYCLRVCVKYIGCEKKCLGISFDIGSTLGVCSATIKLLSKMKGDHLIPGLYDLPSCSAYQGQRKYLEWFLSYFIHQNNFFSLLFASCVWALVMIAVVRLVFLSRMRHVLRQSLIEDTMLVFMGVKPGEDENKKKYSFIHPQNTVKNNTIDWMHPIKKTASQNARAILSILDDDVKKNDDHQYFMRFNFHQLVSQNHHFLPHDADEYNYKSHFAFSLTLVSILSTSFFWWFTTQDKHLAYVLISFLSEIIYKRSIPMELEEFKNFRFCFIFCGGNFFLLLITMLIFFTFMWSIRETILFPVVTFLYYSIMGIMHSRVTLVLWKYSGVEYFYNEILLRGCYLLFYPLFAFVNLYVEAYVEIELTEK